MQKRGPTINDVARLAGVSNMTVSRVANGADNVRGSTRDRVRKAMDDLGYLSNAMARGMRSNSSKMIGFLLPDLTNPLNAMISQMVEIDLAAAGYRMLVATSRFDLERELYYLEQFMSHRVDGIIVMLADEDSKPAIEFIDKGRVPIVVIDRTLPVPADRVLCEHQKAMSDVVRYLSSLGHRRIGLINGPMTMRPTRMRTQAFLDTMAMLGLPVPDTLRRYPEPTVEDGYLAAVEMLRQPDRPTALVIGSNQSLFGVLRAIRELKLEIPRDLSLVGADEDLASEFLDPPLTMIYRDMAQVGEAAVKLLLQRLKDPSLIPGRSLTIESRIILRGSCSTPPEAKPG